MNQSYQYRIDDLIKTWKRRSVPESTIRAVLSLSKITFQGEDQLYLAKHIYEISPYSPLKFAEYIQGFESRYSEEEMILMEKVWNIRQKLVPPVGMI